MAEKQQDLGKKPTELTHEPLQDSDYFSGISLGDIYGNYTLNPGTRIVTDIPNDPRVGHELFKDKKRLRELAKKYNIPRVASGSFGGDRKKQPFIEISAGMGPALTNWAPFVAERGAIAALATSITGKEKPLILEVGAGNGFTSKLLAADNRLRVVGIDPNLPRYKQLPDTPGGVSLREADIFDLIEEFGPARSSQDTAQINEILTRIRDSFMKDKKLYFWGLQHGFFRGMGYDDFSTEVEELTRIASRYREQSPVAVLLCSFMTIGDDLTLAIRDGIRPKAIVYVMPLNELSGVGNYYLEGERKTGRENDIISFNPGREYRTVARWQTFWQDEWGRFCYEQLLGTEQADVVVQLRNDVEPQLPSEVPVVRTYPFDEQIAEAIQTGRKAEKHFKVDYYRGIRGKMELLQPRIDLPYKTLTMGVQ